MPGASESWLMTCNDGQKYVVKFFNEPCDNTVISEFVCNKIASILELPIAKGELVYVEKGLVDTINMTKARKIKEGIHFGTLFLEPSSNLDPAKLQQLGIEKITNEDKVAGIVVFDLLVCNGDRSTNNALITPSNPSTKEFRYVMMDHSHCFGGPNWNDGTIVNHTCTQIGIPWRTTGITSENVFTPYIQKLEQVRKEIRNIATSVPDEWKKRPADLDALIKWIESRNENAILESVKNMKANFPNWI